MRTSPLRHRDLLLESLEARRLLTVDFQRLLTVNPGPLYAPTETIAITDWGDQVALIAAERAGGSPSIWISPDAVDQSIYELVVLPDNRRVNQVFRFTDSQLLVATTAELVGSSPTQMPGNLWLTDGTTDGTILLSDRVTAYEFVAAGDRVFFKSRPNDYEGVSVWTTDGTPAGTLKLLDSRGAQDLEVTSPLAILGGELYVVLKDYRGDRSLSKIGTQPNQAEPVAAFPTGYTGQIITLGNRLVFDNSANSLFTEPSIYSFTQHASEVIALHSISDFEAPPGKLTKSGEAVFIPTVDGQLWTTDGTVAGTKRFLNDQFRFAVNEPARISTVQGNYLFSAYRDGIGASTFFSDGTVNGTRNLGFREVGYPYQRRIVQSDRAFYLIGGDEFDVMHLYAIDAFTGNTQPVAPISALSFHYPPDSPIFPIVIGDRIFYEELIEEQRVLREFNEITGEVRTVWLPVGLQGDDIQFLASDSTNAWQIIADQIWLTKGQSSTTTAVEFAAKQIDAPTIQKPQTLDGQLVLEAGEAAFPSQNFRWSIDGETNLATVLGSLEGSPITEIFAIGERKYQVRNVDALTAAIFELDSHLIPASRIADLPAYYLDYPTEVHQFEGTAYFVLDGVLWQTDGTPMGTGAARLQSESESVASEIRFNSAGELLFASDESRLYKITAPGTATLTSALVQPGLGANYLPGYSTVFLPVENGIVYVNRLDGSLRFTDGVVNQVLLNLSSNDLNSIANVIGMAGDKAIVLARDAKHGTSLWSTDGTIAGTIRIDYQPAGSSFLGLRFNPPTLRLHDGRLVLAHFGARVGHEVLITDGTTNGTQWLADLVPGYASSYPSFFVQLGDTLVTAGGFQTRGDAALLSADLGTLDTTIPNDKLKFFVEENRPGSEIGPIVLADVSQQFIINYAITSIASGKTMSIDPATGQLSLDNSSMYDFENLREDSIVVQVTYQRPADPKPVSRTVTISAMIVDLYEPLKLEDQTFTIDENLPPGKFVGKLAVDNLRDYEITFDLRGGVPYLVDWKTGNIYVPADTSFTNFETLPVMAFIVRVGDSQSFDDATVTIRLRDVNEPPQPSVPVSNLGTFSDQPLSFQFSAGTFVDPEGQPLEYRLAVSADQPLPSWIGFDSQTRTLTTVPAAEHRGVYRLQLIATDPSGSSSAAYFDLSIFDGTMPWHNSLRKEDVNGDGNITPSDALIIINRLDSLESRQLPDTNPKFDSFLDVKADFLVTASDALLVINYLNDRSSREGENELSNLEWQANWLDETDFPNRQLGRFSAKRRD